MKKVGVACNVIRFLPGNVVEIALTRGKVALIELADLPRVREIRWCATQSKGRDEIQSRWYAIGWLKGRGRLILMHQAVMGTRRGIDHINHDGLDNRRSNLRRATCSQNGANARMRSNNTTGYRGVTLVKDRRVFVARIKVKWRQISLGYYKTAEEAARAYDVAAREHFGEFARPNFPKPVAVRSA